MNTESTVRPESDYPFLPELSQEAVVQLQKETASQFNEAVMFQDAMKVGYDGPEMLVIPAGQFEMGAPESEFSHQVEETPQHYVTLKKAFSLGRFPVTNEEFEVFAEDTGWTLGRGLVWGKKKAPVVNIRRSDVLAYIEWICEQTGHRYRLPTEAEWEYAARAGTSTPFHFGNTISDSEVHFNPNFPYKQTKRGRKWFFPRRLPYRAASEVGQKPPNDWGLQDMHGNVWEFTMSPWSDSHANANSDGTAATVDVPQWVVTKGGSWFDAAARGA